MKALLFDLDGTIGNTLPLCIEAFQNAMEPFANRSFSAAEITAQFGPSEEGTIKALIPGHFTEGVEKYIEFYEKWHYKWPEPFEGVVETLQHLRGRGCYLGLVTGKGPRSTQITLETYDLANFFDCVKTGSIHGPVKKERIQEVILETQFDRSEIIYVGDSPSDITDSKECEIKAAAAAWAPTADSHSLMPLRPDYIFNSIQDFRDFVETNYG